MERKDVSIIMKRIKSHYQEFIVDDFKVEEWYKELKDYSLDDVMGKLDLHLKSEQYGNSIPKVYFLTKYLTKEKEKGKEIDGLLQCQLCKQFVDYKDYEDHYDRCSSVDYLDNQYFKYFKKRLEENKKQQLYLVSSDIFNEKYDKMLEYISYHTDNKEEINYINKYFEKEDLENTLD